MAIFPSIMMERGEITLEGVAAKLTYFQEQIHLLHWQTQNYAEHEALGDLYECIQDFKDEVIEKLMGYIGRRPNPYKIEPLTNTPAIRVVSELLNYAVSLKGYAETNKYLDICSLADTLSGTAAKTKYLLTLT